jgi:hypothetical protein
VQKKGEKLDRCGRKEIGWTGVDERRKVGQMQKGNR